MGKTNRLLHGLESYLPGRLSSGWKRALEPQSLEKRWNYWLKMIFAVVVIRRIDVWQGT